MKTYTIQQDGAGTYEIEAEAEEQAVREMAEGIVDSTEDWESQFATDDREEAIEKAMNTLTVKAYDFQTVAEAREWAHRKSLVFGTDEECQEEEERLFDGCTIRERDQND
jgi:hypothetical protein